MPLGLVAVMQIKGPIILKVLVVAEVKVVMKQAVKLLQVMMLREVLLTKIKDQSEKVEVEL